MQGGVVDLIGDLVHHYSLQFYFLLHVQCNVLEHINTPGNVIQLFVQLCILGCQHFQTCIQLWIVQIFQVGKFRGAFDAFGHQVTFTHSCPCSRSCAVRSESTFLQGFTLPHMFEYQIYYFCALVWGPGGSFSLLLGLLICCLLQILQTVRVILQSPELLSDFGGHLYSLFCSHLFRFQKLITLSNQLSDVSHLCRAGFLESSELVYILVCVDRGARWRQFLFQHLQPADEGV
mmetsp:Transcript_5936/g.13504  ORF Transcript_5936/g.13504 Transcript_5936/m.13504 type:complete len:233 (+) Transcript_5936:214-912(+)